MRRILILAFGLALLTSASRAQWTAFNDHVPGAIPSQTHSNATTLKLPAAGGPTTTNVVLKNISTGANLPVTLTITRSANGVTNNPNGSAPSVGTPIYNTFNGFVYFGAAPDCNVELWSNSVGTLTYTFSGLNSSRLYSFKGGAIRNSTGQTNSFTRVELQGAAALTGAHSSRVQVLSSNVVAASFGFNTTNGDIVDWESIDPGPDGVFSIVCSHYFLGNGNTNYNRVNAYAITGLRLEEVVIGPPQIIVQPANQTVFAGDNYTFGVYAAGTPPLSYQWYKNNNLIGGATASNYTATAAFPGDNGAVFKVIVSNGSGSATSSNATLTVSNSRPIILVQPADQTVNAPSGASFSVTANGNKPLSYQWYRNGSMIPGATSSNYTVTPTSIGDGGSKFQVMIYNSVGTTNSREALLTVTVVPVIVMPYTNTWRYVTNGTDLGTAWQAINYNDSSWLQGRGWLGLETDAAGVPAMINTPLPLAGDGGTRVRTFYFRSHFNLPYDPNEVVLVSSNYIDDGAAFYINGREYTPRYNLEAAPAPINYRTLALAASAEGLTAIFTNVIPADYLVQGDNVIAVEVHQVNDTSTDVDFGMGLTAFFVPPQALAITNSPGDRTVTVAASTTFSVGFSGSQPKFQWYKWSNDVPVAITGANGRNYTITNVAPGDAGFYFVVVSNALSAVASGPALLSVIADTGGPTLVAADGTGSGATNVIVSFSEFVTELTATNIANYTISNVTAGGTVAISRAVLNNGTNVVLTSAARGLNVNYLLYVRNVSDFSTNIIAPNSRIPITTAIILIGLEAGGWDFYNPVLGPPLEPYYPGSNWNRFSWQFAPPESDPWGHNRAGLFVYDLNGEDLPGNRNTILSCCATTEAYFRNIFNFNGSPLGATLRLRHVVDDGFVAYLNENEVYRFNMAPGAFNEFTPANVTVGVASSITVDLPATSLRAGTNLFAAELHGISNNDADYVFGVELSTVFSSYGTGTVVITSGPNNVTVQEGSPVTFSFNGIAATTFQWRTNGVAIPGATNSTYSVASVPASWNGRTFSVVASNPGSSATSSNALLTVLADSIAPVLLSAYATSPTSITATFSEALSASTVSPLANYRVTNSAGPNLTVSGATLVNGTNVVLTVNAMSGLTYTLVVSGLRDASTSANLIGSNSTATVGYLLSIPIDSAWRFYTNNTDLGTAWRAIAYNDLASPWTNGPALIADEAASLPEPLKTSISRLDGGNYHYTFYFRYHFTAPFAMTLPVTFRHVIDDGALFYLNTNQFHSFNMSVDGTAVTYTTEATTAIGDGAYNGPYTTNLTFVAGDNVIAVEVHQNGTGSSDVCFGATFSAGVPSVANTTVSAPPLQISKSQGTNVVVTWPGSGFTLEKKNVLSNTNFWVPVTNQQPLTLTPPERTNKATFYRLRGSK